MSAHDIATIQKAEEIAQNFFKAFRPPSKLTLSEWADKYATLSAESSAESGQWTTLPYQKGMMDAITDPEVEQITVMKSARVGYTKILNHAIGFYISQDPCSIMVVQPTIEDAEGYSKDEIAPMIRDTPVLTGLVGEAKAKDGSNTILSKSYPGGTLTIIGANSPRGFRRVSKRVVCFDECDGYPDTAGREGDQIKLGIRRTEWFWNRKIIAGSTPTIKDFSRIEKLFNQSDQRRRFVPCPHCGHMQYLKWGGLKYNYGIKWPEGQPEKAYYMCEKNQCVIEHKYKRWMDERGEWIPTKIGKDGMPEAAPEMKSRHAGFHIWAAYSYSPNATWGHLATEFVESSKDPEALKTFVNTALGECWEDAFSAKLGAEELKTRGELYSPNIIPARALVAGAGVDVQDNRLAISIYGWGRDEEAWVVSHQEIHGDPGQPEVWKQLDNVLFQDYKHELGGTMKLSWAAIDTGGHYTHEAYGYVRDRKRKTKHTHVLAVKGSSQKAKPPIGKPTKQDINYKGQTLVNGVDLYPVGTDTIKTTLMGRMKYDKPDTPGFIHFHSELTDSFFTQITSEKLVVRYVKGVQVREWVPKKKGIRNEALDCIVYCYAGLHYLYTRFNRKTIWDQLEARLKVNNEVAKSIDPQAIPAAQPVEDQTESKLQKDLNKPNMNLNRRGRNFATKW